MTTSTTDAEAIREAFAKIVVEADRDWNGNVAGYRKYLVDRLTDCGLFVLASRREAQEPVAWRVTYADGETVYLRHKPSGDSGVYECAPLYTAPPADAGMREAFVRVLASLAAAISILERTPKAKKAVASDKMFDTMLDDYRKALEAGRQALTAPGATTKSDGGDLPANLAEIIETELTAWRGVNGGGFTTHAAALGISCAIRSAVFRANNTESDGGHGGQPYASTDAVEGASAPNATSGKQEGRTGIEVGASQTPGSSMSSGQSAPIVAGQAPGPSDPSSTRSDVTASLEGDAVERVARIKSLLVSFHRNSCYPEAMTGELNDAAERILATGLVPDEAAVRAEITEARQEAADSLAILDAIADYVGCPHDEELTVDHVRQHYLKLEDAAQRQGIEDAGRIANAQAYGAAREQAIRADERERCAKVADGWLAQFAHHEIKYVSARMYASDAIQDIATAIRKMPQEVKHEAE